MSAAVVFTEAKVATALRQAAAGDGGQKDLIWLDVVGALVSRVRGDGGDAKDSQARA